MPDLNFWNNRWMNNQIGFHQSKTHPMLARHVELFKDHKNVFVPLCGKSLDMIFLRSQGHHVVGVEFSEVAVRDFYRENNPSLSEGIKIIQGDLFLVSKKDLSGLTACYDRASMIAFNSEERKRYAEFLKMSDVEVILMILLDYGDNADLGPPYSVTEKELRELFSDTFLIEKLHTTEFVPRERMKEAGVDVEKEVTWSLRRILR